MGGHEDTERNCLVREAGHGSHFAEELQPWVHVTHVPAESQGKMGSPHEGPSIAKGNMGGSGPRCHKYAKGHSWDCSPGFCWPRGSVLMLRSPRVDRHKCQRCKSTRLTEKGRR